MRPINERPLKKSSVLMLSLVFVLSATLSAQQPGRGGKRPGGGGDNGTQPKDLPQGKQRVADLAADSLTAKWKDATTLEITGTIRNTTKIASQGARVVRILVTGKDGRTETAKEEPIPMVAANGSHKITFHATANKYFDKDLKWSLELAAGDASASNDKKGPMTLDPGTPAGGAAGFDPSNWTLTVYKSTMGGEEFYNVQATPLKDFTNDDIKAARFFKDHAGQQSVTASEAETLRSTLRFGMQNNTLIINKAQLKALGVKTLLVGGSFGGFPD